MGACPPGSNTPVLNENLSAILMLVQIGLGTIKDITFWKKKEKNSKSNEQHARITETPLGRNGTQWWDWTQKNKIKKKT